MSIPLIVCILNLTNSLKQLIDISNWKHWKPLGNLHICKIKNPLNTMNPYVDPPHEWLDNLRNYQTTKDQPIHENLNNYNTIYPEINLKGSNIHTALYSRSIRRVKAKGVGWMADKSFKIVLFNVFVFQKHFKFLPLKGQTWVDYANQKQ